MDTTVAIAVKDQKKSLRWLTEKIGFEKCSDISNLATGWLGRRRRSARKWSFSNFPVPERVGESAACGVDTRDCRATSEELQSSDAPKERPHAV
jgi:hypothetical protein